MEPDQFARLGGDYFTPMIGHAVVDSPAIHPPRNTNTTVNLSTTVTLEEKQKPRLLLVEDNEINLRVRSSFSPPNTLALC